MDEINIFTVLDFIRDNAGKLAKARSERVYLEEFRKSKRAILFQEPLSGTVADKEAYAYAHPDYLAVLDGLKVAVEQEEKLRWLMEGARMRAEVWRSMQATARTEGRITQ